MQKPLQYLCLKRSIHSKNGQSLNILVSPLSVFVTRFLHRLRLIYINAINIIMFEFQSLSGNGETCFRGFFHTIHCYCVKEERLHYKFCSFNDNPGHCLDGLQ